MYRYQRQFKPDFRVRKRHVLTWLYFLQAHHPDYRFYVWHCSFGGAYVPSRRRSRTIWCQITRKKTPPVPEMPQLGYSRHALDPEKSGQLQIHSDGSDESEYDPDEEPTSEA